jgi:ferredoxin
MHSGKARNAKQLKGSVGTADQTVFDFKAMSHILKTAPVGGPLPKSRKRRIRDAISVLESQQFVVAKGDKSEDHSFQDGFNFAFEDCGEAVIAFRERLPHMAAMVKAISIGELELGNRYDESKHNLFFERFDENLLAPQDMAMFPSYLVYLDCENNSTSDGATILEVLCSALPIKIVAQGNKILEDVSPVSAQLSSGPGTQQLANMALGLNDVFVLQSSASSLYRLRQSIVRGLAGDRPALFSVFSGDIESAAIPYLCGAAATETRAFPCFVYDPDAGDNWASRFSLDGNPQVDNDWPLHRLQYEDAEHNRLCEEMTLTLVDFAACDPRYASLFDRIPESDWHDDMLPVAEFLQMDVEKLEDLEPYTLLIDENNDLYRAVVDHRLVEATRRRRDLWRRLQELGGINNSHVATALTEAETAWEQEKQQLLARPADRAQPPGEKSAAVEGTAPAPAVEIANDEAPALETPEVPCDEPWIETIRCTTCNECTELNSKMFAYDDDMRAYIADPDAGSYRQLVEAAETCQVAIIHPGKPRNENEPNLEELIERAEPFNT